MKNGSSARLPVLGCGFSNPRPWTGRNGAKFGNQKTFLDGIEFDSRKEATRWAELSLLQKAGEISELKRQQEFTLIPSQVRGGKVVERPVKYIADFTYRDKDGTFTVEDTKGFKTPEYIIKRKLMLWEFGIQVKEV